MMKLWMAVALALMAAMVGGSNGFASDKIFRFRLSGDPETLDWNRAHTTEETYILLNLMEGLLEIDSKNKIQNRLAEKYVISPDGKTYTFTLRPNVLWQDGVPLKATDFVTSWKRLISPFTAASYAYLLFDVEGAKDFYDGKLKDFSKVGIKALDDRRIEVKLTRPLSYWIYLPSFWPLFPLRQDVLDKHGNSWASPGKMVTLGPFVLESRELGSKVVMVPNPRYWGKKPGITRAEALVIQEDSTAVTLFESGRLDLLKDIPPMDFKRFQGKAELRFFPYISTHYLGFGFSKYPSNLLSVRRAIALAINRQEVVAAMGGKLTPATSFIPPAVDGHRSKGGMEFDPIRARSLLRMAGVDASSLAIEMLVQTSDKSRMIGEIVQAQLKKNLGVTVVIQAYEHKAFREQLQLQAYPMFQLQWSADYPDAENFLSVFLPDSGNNRSGWINGSYGRLVADGKSEMNPKIRTKKYSEADELLVDKEVVIIPLYYSTLASLVSKRSVGIELSPLNYLFLRDASVK